MKKVLLVTTNNNEEIKIIDKKLSDIYFVDYLTINNNLSKTTIDKYNLKNINNLNSPIKLNKKSLFKIGEKYALLNKYDYIFEIDDIKLLNKPVDYYLRETINNNLVLIENKTNKFYKLILNMIYKIKFSNTFQGRLTNNAIYDRKTLEMIEKNNFNSKIIFKSKLKYKELI